MFNDSASGSTGRRDSALWGTGGRGERASALWGGGRDGKRVGLYMFVLAAIAVLAGIGGSVSPAGATTPTAHISSTLYNAAVSNPSGVFNVILQGAKGVSTSTVGTEVSNAMKAYPNSAAKGIKRKFAIVTGDAANLTGQQIVALASDAKIGVITPDAVTRSTGYSNSQYWPSSAKLTAYWNKATNGVKAPTIAFLDSGIDANHTAFGGRVLTQQNFYSGSNANAAGDGFGHGTFTAGIAAGDDAGYAGGVPNVNIVECDVLDDQGSGMTSDMIAALDWIQANKTTYNIKVVNISVMGSESSSFMYDPLDKAVEKLWLNGVVVVTAAGNYASNGAQSGVLYAPANDPFAITVGATDVANSGSTSDDFAAPWSAWGYTNDGFFKPEISAPGRYMNGPVPTAGSTMQSTAPDRVVAPGYMWMSGTSFAAPVVSAAADYVLAMHPTWTPDQVKGALMVSAADPTGYTGGGAMGVGEVAADPATKADGTANPNAGLDQFVITDSTTGLQTFDTNTWYTTAVSNPSWDTMSWSSQSWASATWSSQSWASMSWSSQSWASQSWASQSWASMSWSSQSWANLAWVQ
jgi:serine protease AprX